MRLMWHPHLEVILISEEKKSSLIQKWNLYIYHLPKADQEEFGGQQPFYIVQSTHTRDFSFELLITDLDLPERNRAPK